jgi:hypothetical protein
MRGRGGYACDHGGEGIQACVLPWKQQDFNLVTTFKRHSSTDQGNWQGAIGLTLGKGTEVQRNLTLVCLWEVFG